MAMQIQKEVKTMFVAMQIQYATPCCSTAKEVITTASYSKYWIYLTRQVELGEYSARPGSNSNACNIRLL